MLNSEEEAHTEVPMDDNVLSVVDQIMIEFGRSLGELEGFSTTGADLAILLRREKAPTEAEVRAILEGATK
ncbi:hypothetical protein [Spelaeicoccus albus]|nr:hypothetical protein [Spelaeicoccus albus]